MPVQEDVRGAAAPQAAHEEREVLNHATIETPIGELALAYRGGAVVVCAAYRSAMSFEGAVKRVVGAAPAREPSAPPSIERADRAYFSGEEPFPAVDCSWLPPFQRQVLAKTAEIPRGEVRPYGWIAREIGAPGAAKDVGVALAENPILFLIPCHRVVRSDGSLGGYAGGGPALKRKLLMLEGALLA